MPVETKPSQKVNATDYTPISDLNTFLRDYVICARVQRKSPPKPTAKGGQIMKIELVDNMGT